MLVTHSKKRVLRSNSASNSMPGGTCDLRVSMIVDGRSGFKVLSKLIANCKSSTNLVPRRTMSVVVKTPDPLRGGRSLSERRGRESSNPNLKDLDATSELRVFCSAKAIVMIAKGTEFGEPIGRPKIWCKIIPTVEM